MSTWQEFYTAIKDPSWPPCAAESDYAALPSHIKTECEQIHGYVPGSFKSKSKLTNKRFPIETATACQLKWTWSTLYLTLGMTASCHRTDPHRFDVDKFDFHNTPSKIQDREHMLAGQWPVRGCNYCKDIETAGGQSDRLTNLDFPGIHAPPELDHTPRATAVTPRMLEVYFDNTCNLKCIYCGPHFSSLWDAENIKYEQRPFVKDPNLEKNKQKIFQWLRENRHNLTVFNILGGEPLYQDELQQCLDLFRQYPAPELKLQIFTNLNTKLTRLQNVVSQVRELIDSECLREFEVTASLDCWGAPQEYVRYPLDLGVWEANFEFLISQPWINLIINSTVTPLTVKTLPDLLAKINAWNTVRPVYHYQNSVNGPDHMFIDIFGNVFQQDFDRALALKPVNTPEQKSSKQYLAGIAKQAASQQPNVEKITKLFDTLNTLDSRRSTNWRATFPWLVDEFAKHNLT